MTGAPPLVSEIARPWWEALARDALEMQRCGNCAAWVFYPRPFCPTCGGRELAWMPVEPQATLYSFTIARAAVAPAFAHLAEPILAIVELSNGVRLPTSLVELRPEQAAIGMALAPVFDHATYPGVTMLRFRPTL